MILVQLREDGRHFALAVSVIQGLVDSRRCDPQARSGVAIEHQTRGETEGLLIACHVAQLRKLPQFG